MIPVKQYIEKIENTTFWWWVKNFRVSYLVILMLVLYGTFALIKIPKESSPNIKFGIVQVTTLYPWSNPVDVDSIITEKIYKEIKGIQWIDKVESRSLQWVSSVTITLDNGVVVKDFINDVRTKIDKIAFPDDVKKPIITEIGTDNEVLFQMVMYGPKNVFTMNSLRSLAMNFRKEIISKWSIVDVKVEGVNEDNDFEVSVLIDKAKLEQYGLTVNDVAQQIRQYNQNLPLGDHPLGGLSYDYRISNDIQSLQQLQKLPILLSNGQGNILVWDLATIERKYANEAISYGGKYNVSRQFGVPITIYKADGGNIFADATSAKKIIEDTLNSVEYQNLHVEYTKDLSDVIIDDYKSLGQNGIQSILLVLAITAMFIGLRQSIIATLAMIISFFITFIFLYTTWSTLNFLTNFSLIIAFGWGIDTVLVFIEAAYENMKKWFNPKTAILIAVNTYKSANINTSLINIVVFIPLLVLPGITWKFLSYIPITIFTTLLWSLVLALTVNSALFVAFNKKLTYYFGDDEGDEDTVMSEEEKVILAEEKKWKLMKNKSEEPYFEKVIDVLRGKYLAVLKKTITNRYYRNMSIWLPIVALVASFIFLSPRIGFKLFPSGDNPFITYEITAREGTTTERFSQMISWVDNAIASIPELKSYDISINKNTASIGVNLVKEKERKRDSFVIEKEIAEKLSYLGTKWLRVEWKVQAWWPPVGKAVGIQVTTDNKNKLTQLKAVSKDFEAFLMGLTGTVNVSNSSTENPGQFSLVFDEQKLAKLGLSPVDIKGELYAMMQGAKAGTVSIDSVDRDIVVKVSNFSQEVSPDIIGSTILQTRAGPIAINSVAGIDVWQSLASITRKDADIAITVESDLVAGAKPTDYQPKLSAFAKDYDFPDGISYKEWWENEANKDLIQSTIMAFFVSLLLAFGILVYQFNSFSKPAMVLYSIVTALLWVNIGLWVTGNPYSMAFGIGFISLIGVVVNTAIFLVDRINYNMEHGADIERAIYEAGSTRFKPILISSITTVLWLGSVVTQDAFYAALGWTVIFGLVVSAGITLIAVPNLYYLLLKKEERKALEWPSEYGGFHRITSIFQKILQNIERLWVRS
jgi:multidrug efflux pump subunit AcrB